MSNKYIFQGAKLEIINKTAGLDTTELTTNKEKIKIKNALLGDNLNTLDKSLEITGNLTVNGDATITGCISSTNPLECIGDSKYFNAYLDAPTNVNGQDDTWYLSTLNNMVVREGGDNFLVDKYILESDGNYKVNVNLVADNFSDEFKTVVEALDDADNIEEKFNLDWSSSGYGRNSSVVMPNRTAGKKIRINIYNPSPLGQTIAGRIITEVNVVAVAPPAMAFMSGNYKRVEVGLGLLLKKNPPSVFIPDTTATPSAIYRFDDVLITYVLYKLENNFWHISKHTTATLDANLIANSNDWELIGELLSPANGYLVGSNMIVSRTQSATNVGGFYGPGTPYGTWPPGTFSEPLPVSEYNTQFTIYKL